MGKKAQAVSMNVIIIGAIALVVLVIMIMIFTGNIGKWRTSTENCQSQRGQCVSGKDFKPIVVRNGRDVSEPDGVADDCAGDYQNVINAICDENGDGEQDFEMDGERKVEKICCVSS